MQHSYIVPVCKKQIRIIYQDEHFLLVDKPEFLLSVPGRRAENKDSVITRLQQDYPTARIVHRLDLDTSGIMVIPLSAAALSAFGRMFQRREITKEYEALVFGRPRDKYGCIELPIARDWRYRPRQKIDFINGKASRTDYQTLSVAERNNITPVIMAAQRALTSVAHSFAQRRPPYSGLRFIRT